MSIIRVIDTETNGLAPPAEVLECATCDLDNASGEWIVGIAKAQLFACTAPMDPGARAAHHIRPQELEGQLHFSGVRDMDAGADAVACHNWDFDGQFLAGALSENVRAICTYKAALRIWPDAPSHSNGALRYWLEDKGLIKPAWSLTQPPHRAGPDAYVTAWLLKALLEAGATGKDMIAWTKQPRLLPTCPIGKERGKKWPDVDKGFLDWMVKNQTMEDDLKWNARRELDRRAIDQRV